MTAQDCFDAKIKLGKVGKRAGERIQGIIAAAMKQAQAGDETAMRDALSKALAIAEKDAQKKVAVASGSIVAQTNVLRAQAAFEGKLNSLRKSPGLFGLGNRAPVGLGSNQSPLGPAVNSLLVRDIRDIATWGNVYYDAVALRKESMSRFADAIDYLRPKKLGLAPETAREADVLRALFGQDASPQSKAVAEAFASEAELRRAEFNKAAGYEAIPKREDWRIGNPAMEQAKVQAWSPDAFAAKVATFLDRDKMIDFQTGERMSDARLQEVLRDVHETARLDGAEGQPNAGYVGEGPLSARRQAQRTLMFKGPEEWEQFNQLFGSGSGVFDAMLRHFSSLAHDTAIMNHLGPDPASTRRFILSLFDREAARLAKTGNPEDAASMAAAVKANRRSASSVENQRASFEAYWAHMTGEAGVPVNAELAKDIGNIRHVMMASQLGTSIFAALTDTGLVASAARFNGLPVMGTIGRMVSMLAEGRSAEINAMQAGVVSDSLAHGAGMTDRYLGETIRTGLPAKMSSAVIRGIGHRRWTSILRASFAMEFMARMANAVERGTDFQQLPFREALERYGVGRAEWEQAAAHAKANGLWEPRPGARFLRPMDLKGELSPVGASLARMLQTEMDFTAIEGDPVTKAWLNGAVLPATRPGSLGGEALRGLAMYRSWPTTIIATHIMRGLARGWDGSRLSHAAFTFAAMSLFGVLAMQAKEITAGRDPLSLDPATVEGRGAWVKAIMQGGGFGVFGDIALQDKTKNDNSWASTVAGPFGSLAEDVAGKWAIKNIQLASQGRETHFLGDALWIGSRYLPGSNVWYWRVAFGRAVTDQLLLMADDRAHERFARIEERARADFHQEYWWRRGQSAPDRAPAIGGAP